MNTQTELPLLGLLTSSRRHDLPPKWDGQPVTWTPWETAPRSSLDWHLHPHCCTECGTIQPTVYSKGLIAPEPGTYMTYDRTKTLPSGRQYTKTAKSRAWPVYELIATRCQHCRTDLVLDLHTHEEWVLDDQDYSDDGSHEPESSQP